MMKAKDLKLALVAGEFSQREAARLLGIDERTMRRYCSGEAPIPTVVELAIDHLVFCMDHDELDQLAKRRERK